MERTFDCKRENFDAHSSDIGSGNFTDQRGELVSVTVNLSIGNSSEIMLDKYRKTWYIVHNP